MLKFIIYGYFLIFFNTNIVICSKIWLETTSDLLNNENWESGLQPCDYDQIIFPGSFPAAIILGKNLAADSLILPKDGVFIFGESNSLISESVFALTNGIKKDNEKNKKCRKRNNMAFWKSSSTLFTKFWFDPKSWKTSRKINSATPDLEKIPCSYDTVIMPNKGSLSINFENINNLEVNAIEMGGVNTTWKIFQNDLYSDIAHIMFKDADDFNVIFNNFKEKDFCECHKDDFFKEYEKRVCNHIKNQCEKNYPKCLNPIKPYGHCCEICGSVLKIFIDDCASFDLHLFKKFVESNIHDQGMEDYIEYYVSIIREDMFSYLQLIILDKNDYNELSTDFMKHIKKTFTMSTYSSNKKLFYSSGIKYDKNNPENPWKFVILPLLGTTVFFIIMYMHFVTGQIQIPNWLYQNRFGLFNSSFVFARFDNNQGELEIAENINRPRIQIEALRKNDDENDSENTDKDVPRAFDNPMFDEKLEVPSSPNIENLSIASDSTELTMICLDDN